MARTFANAMKSRSAWAAALSRLDRPRRQVATSPGRRGDGAAHAPDRDAHGPRAGRAHGARRRDRHRRGNPVTIPVLGNDSDPSGLSFGSVTVGTQPTPRVDHPDRPRDRRHHLPARAAISGTDTFTYTFRDRFNVQSNAATVTVIVNRPVANDDFSNTVSGQPVVINSSDNDADPDGNDHSCPVQRGDRLAPGPRDGHPQRRRLVHLHAGPRLRGDRPLRLHDHGQGRRRLERRDRHHRRVGAPPAAPGTVAQRRRDGHRRGEPRDGHRPGQRRQPRGLQPGDRHARLAARPRDGQRWTRHRRDHLQPRHAVLRHRHLHLHREGQERRDRRPGAGCRWWSTGRRPTTTSPRPSAPRRSRSTWRATTPTPTATTTSTRRPSNS